MCQLLQLGYDCDKKVTNIQPYEGLDEVILSSFSDKLLKYSEMLTRS